MGDFRQGRFGRSSGGSSFRGRSGGFRRDRDSERFERRPLEMHKTVCSKCKKECEVPFKPTGDKPVYCSDCFKKNDRSNSSGMSSEQFDKINEKLNEIISLLEKSNK